jgi:predicted nucleic-acid-binding Zn-ribbon protein
MFLYKCPECDNTELDFDTDYNEDEDEKSTFSKDMLLGSTSKKIFKVASNKKPTRAYCKKCDRNWTEELLEKEDISSASMIKFIMILMMISVMFFLAGLLLLVFSLLLGAIVIAGSLLLLFIATILYKRS